MAWEQRGGKFYYYRKHRQGERVISEYVGRDRLAVLEAALDKQMRAVRLKEHVQRQKAQAEYLELSRQVDQAGGQIRAITRAALLAYGFYQHKGTWRRMRE